MLRWHNERVGWTPYDQMSRLEQKMYWAVRESAMLHEVPGLEVDDPGSPGEVVVEDHTKKGRLSLAAWNYS